MSATNTSADTCEAGLFQMIWNMKTASPSMGKLLEYFWGDPNGFLPTFCGRADADLGRADELRQRPGRGVSVPGQVQPELLHADGGDRPAQAAQALGADQPQRGRADRGSRRRAQAGASA